jgi:hypothetical protein
MKSENLSRFGKPCQKSLPSSLFQREESFGEGIAGRSHFAPLWKRKAVKNEGRESLART